MIASIAGPNFAIVFRARLRLLLSWELVGDHFAIISHNSFRQAELIYAGYFWGSCGAY